MTYNIENRIAQSFAIPTEIYSNAKQRPVITISGDVILAEHAPVNYFNPDKGKRAAYKEEKPADDYEVVLSRVRQYQESKSVGERPYTERDSTGRQGCDTEEIIFPIINNKSQTGLCRSAIYVYRKSGYTPATYGRRVYPLFFSIYCYAL